MNRGVVALMAVVIIASGLYELYQSVPLLMPILFIVSSIGLAARLAMLAHETRKQKDPSAAINFGKLRKKDLSALAAALKRDLRGHDAVIDRLTARLSQGFATAAAHKTVGSFLLVGPTGTGKTFLGELTAKAVYRDREPVVLRMNQYKHHEDVFTLVGPPPGYRGSDVGGALTRPILEDPYRVVVLDELDKAHADVRHCLYDILDQGRCQEKSSGKTVHFNAAIVFATCNSGVEALRTIWRESDDPVARRGRAREALAREGFERPLLARFTEIFLMDRLRPIETAEVACLQISQHWKQYGIEVSYASPEILLEAVKRNAEFQDYGVRQLAHLIQELTVESIEAARRAGARRVRLDLDRTTGRMIVQR